MKLSRSTQSNAGVAPATPWVGYHLALLTHRIRAATGAALAPLGLKPPTLRALDIIAAHAPLTQTELGQRVAMDRTTIVAMIDAFEALGAAARTPDPSDRRSHHIVLTRFGAELLERASKAAYAVEEEILAPLSVVERTRFTALLAKLHRAGQREDAA